MAMLLSPADPASRPANRAERRAEITIEDRKKQFLDDLRNHIQKRPGFHKLPDRIAQPLGELVRAMVHGNNESTRDAANKLRRVSPTWYHIAKSEFDATLRLKRGAMRGIGLPGASLPAD